MPKFIETNLQPGSQKKDLHQFDVFIEDDSRTSPRYFNISQLSNEFSLGKNAFLIRGTEKLRSGSKILVEVLDVNGNVIFSRTHDYKESRARIISVFVFEDTPTGPCNISIMGEAEVDDSGDMIPAKWSGRYNIRWNRKVNVNPNVYNINRVRFIREPEISVDKLTLSDLNLNYQGTAPTRETIYNSTLPSPPIGLKGRINFNASGTKNSILRVNKNCGSFVGFIRGMENGELTLRDTSNLNLTEASLGGNELPEELRFSVERIRDENTLTLTPLGEARNFSQTIELECYNDFEVEFVREDPTNVNVLQSRTCFIQIELSDIRTFAGAVLRAAVYARDFRTDDAYTFVGDFELPPEELMKDLNSVDTPKNKRVGVFLDQSDVSKFLLPLNNYSSLDRDSEQLLNSVNVKRVENGNTLDNINYDPSSDDYGGAAVDGNPNVFVKSHSSNISGFSIDDDSDQVVGFKFPFLEKNGSVTLESNTRYTLSFRYRLENFGERVDNGKFGVFLRYKTDDENGILEIEERLKTVEVRNGIHKFEEVEIDFEPSRESLSGKDDDLQLVIKVLDGNFYFSDFSLIPLQRPGFSPDFTTFFFPLERSILQELGDEIEFKVDLFDLDRNKIPVSLNSNEGVYISDCGRQDVGGGGDVISGTAAFQGDYETKEFVIDHNVGINPVSWTVTPTTDDASAISHTKADNSTITVIYDTAPPTPSGDSPLNNLQFNYTLVIN